MAMDQESRKTPPGQEPRVLSVQSTVVHGYVGNRSAMFPMQLLGLEVDPIYSVQFSNHTGYPSFKGAVFDGEHLGALLQGLKDNGLMAYTHLLTGYIGSVSLLEMIAEVSRQLRQVNPNLEYVCDPVMGDEGRLYVNPDMVDAFRDHIVPLASIIVPNQFEAELLTGLAEHRPPGPPTGSAGEAPSTSTSTSGGGGEAGHKQLGGITSVARGFEACERLHAMGPHTVVITSMALPSDPDHIMLLASTRRAQARGEGAQRLTLRIPRIRAYFTGTGDLLAALLLAWLHHHPDDLATAIEQAVAGLQAVLHDTARACGAAALAAERTSEVCNARELRLIQNRQLIVNPVVELRCVDYVPETAAGVQPATAAAAQ